MKSNIKKERERCFTKRKNITVNQKIEQYGFFLKQSRIQRCYNVKIRKRFNQGLPVTCPCSQKCDTAHALNCKKGGFVTIRHNNIRDYEGNSFAKIHTDVETEPSLQPIEGEIVNGIPGDNAKPDIRARGVWREGQNASFDVRITNLNSASQHNVKAEKVLWRHEKEKKREYNRRIRDIEHGTFTPLVFQ